MHAVYLARPNVVPILVTTGVGPDGPKSILHQPPTSTSADGKDHVTDVDGSTMGGSSHTFGSDRTNTVPKTLAQSATKCHSDAKPSNAS